MLSKNKRGRGGVYGESAVYRLERRIAAKEGLDLEWLQLKEIMVVAGPETKNIDRGLFGHRSGKSSGFGETSIFDLKQMITPTMESRHQGAHRKMVKGFMWPETEVTKHFAIEMRVWSSFLRSLSPVWGGPGVGQGYDVFFCNSTVLQVLGTPIFKVIAGSQFQLSR